jgi:hypothetical protein
LASMMTTLTEMATFRECSSRPICSFSAALMTAVTLALCEGPEAPPAVPDAAPS